MSTNTAFLTGSVRKEYTLKPLCPFPNSFTEKSNENSEIKVALIIRCVSFLPIMLSSSSLIFWFSLIRSNTAVPTMIEYKKIVDIKADLFSFILRKEPLNDSLYNLEIKFTSIIYLPKK
jgi:hypothetical protein